MVAEEADPMATVRKRLVLHIGFHRAGSAAVHESLHGARVALRDHRVVYPQPLSGHPSHLDVATALGFNPRDELGQLDRASVLERYRRLIDDCPPGSVIVLASEEFCLGNFLPRAMESLQVFLDKLDVELTVSAAVRDPLAFLVDVYQTELRDTDSAADFAQWLDGFDLTGADFDGRLEVWRQLLGPTDELRIRSVDEPEPESAPHGPHAPDGRDERSPVAIVNRVDRGRRALDGVLDDCGVDRAAVPLIGPPGVELHPRLVEPLLAVRRRVPELADRRRLLEALLEVSPLLDPVADPAAVHLDPDTRDRIAARLAPSEVDADPAPGPDQPDPDDNHERHQA